MLLLENGKLCPQKQRKSKMIVETSGEHVFSGTDTEVEKFIVAMLGSGAFTREEVMEACFVKFGPAKKNKGNSTYGCTVSRLDKKGIVMKTGERVLEGNAVVSVMAFNLGTPVERMSNGEYLTAIKEARDRGDLTEMNLLIEESSKTRKQWFYSLPEENRKPAKLWEDTRDSSRLVRRRQES